MIADDWSLSQLFLLMFSCMFATYLFRLLPFLMADYLKNMPIFDYLNQQLPAAIMAILAVGSIISTDWQSYPFAMPEIMGAIMALLLHHIFRNNLFSIIVPTILYMLLKTYIC